VTLAGMTRCLLGAGAYGGAALGVLCALGLIAAGNIDGTISLDIALSPVDGLWALFGLPVLLVLLFLLVAPLAWLLERGAARLRGGLRRA
jgi:hypothetical protein